MGMGLNQTGHYKATIISSLKSGGSSRSTELGGAVSTNSRAALHLTHHGQTGRLSLGQGQTAGIWLKIQRKENFLKVWLCTDLHNDKLGRKQSRRQDMRCEL
jgi:hypothetical protein